MPADSMTASAAIFDHETESRRRRPAPDWGGDDLFDHVPRRRFASTQEAGARRREAPEPSTARRREAPEHRRPAGIEELVEARRAEYEPQPQPGYAVAPNGRRTVTVTGRPGPAFAPRTSGPARRREPRTVEERIGARPDQVAAWAFALGVLLILIALLV